MERVPPTAPEPYAVALAAACRQIAAMSERFAGQFPSFGIDGRYQLGGNDDWVSGFWPGMLWLMHAATGDLDIRARAESLLPSFAERLERKIDVAHHDMGFLYLLSARAQSLLGSRRGPARELAIAAGRHLARRYRREGRYIQAWGELSDTTETRAIIDTMMNVQLLWWTARQTDDDGLRQIAVSHTETTAKYLIRADGSTYHTFYFDRDTGEPSGPRTRQGYADDSLWARGQAWAIYGFATAAEWCDEPRYVDIAERAAERFLAELPADWVPTWDLRLPAGAPRHLDSSAGAIAAGGLMRLARARSGDAARAHRAAAGKLMDALLLRCFAHGGDAASAARTSSRPTNDTDERGLQGLLRHGNYNTPDDRAIDSFVIFGDYFFFETLCVFADKAPDFWGPDQ